MPMLKPRLKGNLLRATIIHPEIGYFESLRRDAEHSAGNLVSSLPLEPKVVQRDANPKNYTVFPALIPHLKAGVLPRITATTYQSVAAERFSLTLKLN